MLDIKLSIPRDASQLVIVYHPTTTEELRNKLWPLKLSYGDFQNVLKNPEIYNTLQVLAAHGPLDGIHAWAGIYTRHGETFVGVYVDKAYRKQGLGAKLKNEALRLCKEQGKTCIWQDRNGGDEWVKVNAEDGTEQRFPYSHYDQ